MRTILLAGLAVIWLAAIFVFVLYNRLVRLRNRSRQAFSEIDVQLKRRHDLIPNVVETAKGYLKHERGAFEAVTTARTEAIAAGQAVQGNPDNRQAMHRLGEAEASLSGALGRLLAIGEAYHELKANQSMANLMEELTTTENRIALARQAYNDAAMFYNTAVQTLPASLVAAQLHFSAAEFFALDNAADKQVPTAAFSSPSP